MLQSHNYLHILRCMRHPNVLKINIIYTKVMSMYLRIASLIMFFSGRRPQGCDYCLPRRRRHFFRTSKQFLTSQVNLDYGLEQTLNHLKTINIPDRDQRSEQALMAYRGADKKLLSNISTKEGRVRGGLKIWKIKG